MTGSDALLNALAEQGVEVIFGNPGTTELPFVQSLAGPGRPRFVLGLTEPVAVGMADGYAQTTGRLGVVLVHVQPGMANALSGILNAARARVPMLVIVGQQVQEMLPGAPFLGGDVIGMCRPLVRFAEEVTDAAQLGDVLSRAVAAAYGPPAGPAVISVPLDVQSAEAPPLRTEPWGPRRLGAPAAADIDRAVALLTGARRPIILAGDSVADADAGRLLSRLAARIGAPVRGEAFGARLPMFTGDQAWQGTTPRFANEIHGLLEGHDVVLAVGMPMFRLFGWSPGASVPTGTRVIHIDVDPAEIGRMVTPDVGIVADPDIALAALLDGLGDPDEEATERAQHVGAASREMRDAAAVAVQSRATSNDTRISPAALSRAIADAVTPDDLLIDEGITATRDLRAAVGDRAPGSCLWHRGSALGWGLPAGVGASLATPSRPVVVVQGDGSLMFGVPALWTAAREGLNVALVVADNGGYEVLEGGMRALAGPQADAWPGLDLSGPRMDIAKICAGFGATAATVCHADDVSAAMTDLRARSGYGPAVLVAEITR